MNPHDKAQRGLSLLRESVLELLEGYPEGLRERDICTALGFKSHAERRQQDYLSYFILGQLMMSGAIAKSGEGIYRLVSISTSQSTVAGDELSAAKKPSPSLV